MVVDIKKIEGLQKTDKFPIIFFIEEWDEQIVSKLNEAVSTIYGNKGVI
jgi:hypothetical protein